MLAVYLRPQPLSAFLDQSQLVLVDVPITFQLGLDKSPLPCSASLVMQACLFFHVEMLSHRFLR